ncbi:MAG: GbsR/MarR family transcriptional regulator [Cyclobacteriaceae bacterium]
MEFEKAKEEFISAWGNLGSNWGINRTMAQIHALLLISPVALTTEDMMEELKISRGNTSMNTRALIDWGVVKKENKLGDRKEYFVATKDVWELARRIAQERKKRELDPLLATLENLQNIEGEGKQVDELKTITQQIGTFAKKADKLLTFFSKAKYSWFTSLLR